MVVWAKVCVVEVKMEVVWVDGLLAGTLFLSTEHCSMEKIVLLSCRH